MSRRAELRIVLIYPADTDRGDAIESYAARVTDQLRLDGSDAVLLRPALGRGLARSLLRALSGRDETALLVQYNPFSWGRWGVAPALVAALALVRLRRPNVRTVLNIHEAYVPMENLRWVLMGAWQRAQVRILLALSHSAVATTGYLADELSRGWPRRAMTLVPVGSNLPDERSSRADARAEAGYGGRLVIATFSSGHISHLHALVAGAVEAVARASSQPVVLLLLGKGNVPPGGVAAVERTVAPGYQDERALARSLSTADVFLGPFADGATTHRTTLVSALQHALPVVTTVSKRTEPMLMQGAVALAPADDRDAFADQAVRLGLDAALRSQQGLSARLLYERWFAWDVVCAGLCQVIAETFAAAPRRSRGRPAA